jgi:cob(I)alamin adenosyltransferase
MVIVDECLYAVQLGVISSEDLIRVVKGKAPHTECVLTGSHKRLPEIEEIADLVTEVRKIKHPFDRGIKARLGTEF